MARGHRDSVSSSASKSELFRNATRDFLINASLLVQPEDGASNGLNRYYQMKINSLINEDEDDVNYILKLSENSTRCMKCGTTKFLRLKSRKNENKSSDRKHCRYLRSLCREICDSCHYCKTHKLINPKSLKRTTILHEEAINRKMKCNLKLDQSISKQRTKTVKDKKKKVNEKIIPFKTQINPPSFSSRLRAFSCLLKK